MKHNADGAADLRRFGDVRKLMLDDVEVRAALVDRTLGIARNDVGNACGHQHFGDSNTCSTSAGDNHSQVCHVFADDLERVVQRCERHDRSAVLIVVEDRNVELSAKPVLNFESGWGCNVLKVDVAEYRGDALDRFDDHFSAFFI